jgi:hypothetical protein
LRRSAADFYARKYFAERGVLPVGPHRVTVTRGPANSGAAIGHPMSSQVGKLEVEITFPGEAPCANEMERTSRVGEK